MKYSVVSAAAALGLAIASPVDLQERAGSVQGFDISHYQGTINFAGAYNSGARFVIIKVMLSS